MNTTAGRQDKAGFPAAGTSFLSVCLHIVLCRSLGIPSRLASGAFFQLYFSFNAPRAVAHDMLQIGYRRTFAGAGISTLHHADCISGIAR
jgi:hypothetical protein